MPRHQSQVSCVRGFDARATVQGDGQGRGCGLTRPCRRRPATPARQRRASAPPHRPPRRAGRPRLTGGPQRRQIRQLPFVPFAHVLPQRLLQQPGRRTHPAQHRPVAERPPRRVRVVQQHRQSDHGSPHSGPGDRRPLAPLAVTRNPHQRHDPEDQPHRREADRQRQHEGRHRHPTERRMHHRLPRHAGRRRRAIPVGAGRGRAGRRYMGRRRRRHGHGPVPFRQS